MVRTASNPQWADHCPHPANPAGKPRGSFFQLDEQAACVVVAAARADGAPHCCRDIDTPPSCSHEASKDCTRRCTSTSAGPEHFQPMQHTQVSMLTPAASGRRESQFVHASKYKHVAFGCLCIVWGTVSSPGGGCAIKLLLRYR